MNLHPWILTAWRRTEAAGVWGASVGIASVGNPLFLGVQNFLRPKMSHAYKEEGVKALRNIVFKATIIFCVPIIIFFLVILFFGGSLVIIIYGDKYDGSG